MIALLQQEMPRRKDVVAKMRAAINKMTFNFKPTQAAFEDIKSSGNLNILQDVGLKKKLLNYYAVLNGYINVIDLNTGTALQVYTNPNKDFVDIGFQDIEGVRRELDTTIVDVHKFETINFPSPKVRKQLMSEEMFYLQINSRKKDLCNLMKVEIMSMKKVLEEKCSTN